MNIDHYVERELLHLESVLMHEWNETFTPAYWNTRLGALSDIATIPDQRTRLSRLQKKLQRFVSPALAA